MNVQQINIQLYIPGPVWHFLNFETQFTCSWLKKSKRVLALTPLSQPMAPFDSFFSFFRVATCSIDAHSLSRSEWPPLIAFRLAFCQWLLFS